MEERGGSNRRRFLEGIQHQRKAKKPGEKGNLPDITHLIRSIQRVEGDPDCFRRIKKDCDKIDCCWREYCLESHQTTKDR